MLKSKRRLIIIVSILGVLLLLLILGGALFSLRGVTVEYNYTYGSEHIKNYNKDEIVRVGNFPFGKNILFQEYSSCFERIEEAFPYAKVYGTTRHFPNKLIVCISEREPVVRFQTKTGSWAVLDVELKVLNIASFDNLTEFERGLPVYEPLDGETASLGKKLSSEANKSIITSIRQAVGDNDSNLSMAFIENISVTESAGDITVVKIVLDDDGLTIKIFGTNNLAQRALQAFNFYQTHVDHSQDLSNYVITVTESGLLSAG